MILLLLSLLSCQDKPLAIDEAQNLQKNGNTKEAFLKYETIASGDFDVLSKEKAKLQLQHFYSSYAEKLGPVDEDLAIKLNTKIIERWENSASADVAKSRINDLLKKKDEKEVHIQRDKDDCEKAQEANDRALWEIYAQKHPVGVCIKEARKRLALLVPTSEHRMKLESFLTKCENIQKKCSQYESRFLTIKSNREFQYLISTFSVFLEKLNTQDQELQNEINTHILDLQKQNYDVEDLKITAQQRCPTCSTAQKNLDDISACKKAIDKNSKEGWDIYKTSFPNGGCHP
jgi:hypothetical protein